MSATITTTLGERSLHAASKNIESDLVQVEHEFDQATADRNIAKLDELMADEFITTDPSGNVSDKQEELKALRESRGDGTVIDSVANEDIAVRLIAEHAAVVTGRITVVGHTPKGPLNVKFRYTNTFVRRKRWQIVASQQTSLS